MAKKPPTRILLNLPPDWLAAFEAAAKRQRLTLSAWLRFAGALQLSDAARARLSPELKPGRQPKE